MTPASLADLCRQLGRVLERTQGAADDPAVIFGPGERQLAEAWAERERQRVARQGIIVGSAGSGLRRAAVLIPLVARSDGATVLLTQRTAHLAAHAGQISFPGGRLEPQDRDARAAALRETAEEIGLPERHIELIGALEDYGTVSGFRVTPVVGLITPPFSLAPDPTEVAAVFEVPLTFILDPANRRHAVERRDGIERDIYEFLFAEHRIWGFTARLLVRLAEAIDGVAAIESGDKAMMDERKLHGVKD